MFFLLILSMLHYIQCNTTCYYISSFGFLLHVQI